MAHLTPAQVLERRRERLLNQDTEGFVDLFAPGGVLEMPFTGPDLPARLDGQQAIRDYSRRIAASALRIDDLDTVAVHHTDDPEVLIVELVAKATITTTGHPADDPLLDHLSPLGWEHINLTGDYTWNNPRQPKPGNLRPLRRPGSP